MCVCDAIPHIYILFPWIRSQFFTTRKRKKVIPISTLCPSQDKKEDLVGISVGDICAHERVKLKITEYRHWALKLAYNLLCLTLLQTTGHEQSYSYTSILLVSKTTLVPWMYILILISNSVAFKPQTVEAQSWNLKVQFTNECLIS